MPSKSIRILQVVGGMNRGGTETWLMHVLRRINRDSLEMDFLVHSTEPGAYDDEIRSLGSAVIQCLDPSRPLAYARDLKRVFSEHRPYDIVHSHVHHYSGHVLRIAHRAGVRTRIAHSHSDTAAIEEAAATPRQVYLRVMKLWIRRHATKKLAASRAAAVALYGPRWEFDPRCGVLYCGIDLTPFRTPYSRHDVRVELGLPSDALVVGHVGRFVEAKNHDFLLDIAAVLLQQLPQSRLLLVGDGPRRIETERLVRSTPLRDQVLFCGLRTDVPRLLRGAVDVFTLPSRYEGLPLALLEAQAAGLPCIVSESVSEEALVVPALVRRLSLDRPPNAWAHAILEAAKTRGDVPRGDELRFLEGSPFDADVSCRNLVRYYHASASRDRAVAALNP